MQRATLYSRAGRKPLPEPTVEGASQRSTAASRHPTTPPAAPPGGSSKWRRPWRAQALRAVALWVLALLMTLTTGAALWQVRTSGSRAPKLQEMERVLRANLTKHPLPAAESAAYAKISPSVVRVMGYAHAADDPSGPTPSDGPAQAPGPHKRGAAPPAKGGADDDGPSVGTGVVIQDNGTILTNLHVIEGARHLKVQFHDGLNAEAEVLSIDRKQDLAVIRALQIPDDLQAAVLHSSGDLRPGDHVMAVGFPFGIGPSASAGVVSGLGREFRTPAGGHTLHHLIQFDAAANPGNSGGPLVTQQGEVVGIVTAILNPSQARTFIGIGFAVPIENAAAAAGMPPF